MSRVQQLLGGIAAALRAAETAPGIRLFADVRVELDRYDLADLIQESTRTPACRVCFLAGKRVKNPDGSRDLDVSVALVVVAGREGRPNPDFGTADSAALDLIAGVADVIEADPYVGLVQLQAADLGQELVAVSEASSKKGMAIALVEAKWRLLQITVARPAVQIGLGLAGLDVPPVGYQVNDGDVVPLPVTP
jgi:hypothetical protein